MRQATGGSPSRSRPQPADGGSLCYLGECGLLTDEANNQIDRVKGRQVEARVASDVKSGGGGWHNL